MALLGRFLVPQGGRASAVRCNRLLRTAPLILSSRDSRQLTKTGCGKLVRFTDNPEALRSWQFPINVNRSAICAGKRVIGDR
jgi:hypothetical protein